jgi:hypothetical protein
MGEHENDVIHGTFISRHNDWLIFAVVKGNLSSATLLKCPFRVVKEKFISNGDSQVS